MSSSLKYKIILSSVKLIRKNGLAKVSMHDIIIESGISSRTFYNYFKSKEALLDCIILTSIDDDRTAFLRARKESGNALENILKAVSHSYAKNSVMHTDLMNDIHHYYPAAHKIIEDFIRGFAYKYYRNTILRGIKQGYFRYDLNPGIQALFNLYTATCSLKRISVIDKKHSPGMLFRDIQRNFIYGLCSEKGLKLLRTYSNQYPIMYK